MIHKNKKQILIIILLCFLTIGVSIGYGIHRQEAKAEQQSMQVDTKLLPDSKDITGILYMDDINASKNHKHLAITIGYSQSALASMSIFDKNYSVKLVSSPSFLYKGIHLNYHFDRKNNKGILYINSSRKLPNRLLKIKLKEKESSSTYCIKVDPYVQKN